MLDAGVIGYRDTLDSVVQRFEILNDLHKEEIITDEEYTTRRWQIITEMTENVSPMIKKGVSSRTLALSDSSEYESSVYTCVEEDMDNHNTKFAGMTQINKYPPPDWSSPSYRAEKATKITYDFTSKQWKRQDTMIKLAMEPFDKGELHLVFHLMDMHNPGTLFVAKLSRDSQNCSDTFFDGVKAIAAAAHFAIKYNKYGPPTKVHFLPTFILELKQREGLPVCGVERFIKGKYRKLSNKSDWVFEDNRNTVSAFAHFTWEASNRQLIICDITYSDNVYTDLQIHSIETKVFGKGNKGKAGINKLLRSHKCNHICHFLHLPKMNEVVMVKRELFLDKKLQKDSKIGKSQYNVFPVETYMFDIPPKGTSKYCACNIL